MSARFVDYWESYGMPHDDRTKDYLETEDLMVKGKFSFLNKQLKLSAKTKFNSEGGLKGASDYTLTHTLSPWSSYMLIHKPNNVTLDGNFKLWAQDELFVSLYTNMALTQTATKRELPSKLHVRVHNADNLVVSAGVEKLDLVNSRRPDVLSAWGLYGYNLRDQNVRVFAGPYLGFQISTKALLFQRYLVGVKRDNFTTYLEAEVNRNVTKSLNAENKEVESVSYAKNVTLRFNGNVDKNLKVLGDLAYNFDSTKLAAKAVGQYQIDDSTLVKVRVQNDNSLTVGLNRNYRGLVNFAFTTRFEGVIPAAAPKLKEGEIATPSTTPSLSHFKTKFGLTVEFSETL